MNLFKSKIFLAIVALILIHLGLTAWNGSLFKQHYFDAEYWQFTENLNQELAPLDIQVVAEPVALTTGFFSSQGQFKIALSHSTEEDSTAALTLNHKISHSPFSLARLVQFKLFPVLAQSFITADEIDTLFSKEFKEKSQNEFSEYLEVTKAFLAASSLHLTHAYNGKLQGKLQVAPFQLEVGELSRINSSKASILFEQDENQNFTFFEVDYDNFNLLIGFPGNDSAELNLNGLHSTIKNKDHTTAQNSRLKGFSVQNKIHNELSGFALKNVRSTVEAKFQDEQNNYLVDSSTHIEIQDFYLNDVPVFAFKTNYNLKHVNFETLKQTTVGDFVENPAEFFADVFNDQSSLEIQAFDFTANKSLLSLQSYLNFAPRSSILDAKVMAGIDFSIDKTFVEELVKNLRKALPENDPMALLNAPEQSTAMEFEMFAQSLAATGYLKDTKKSYQTKVSYSYESPDSIDINGEEIDVTILRQTLGLLFPALL